MIVYEYISKKHAFVTSSSSRKKLSHVGVQVLNYKPMLPVATATSESSHFWTFSLLDASDIIYVFKPSDGSNFAYVVDGCYSVPSIVQEMFRSIKMDLLITRYNQERQRLRADQAGCEDEEQG